MMNVLKRKNMYFSLISHCFVICKKNKKKRSRCPKKMFFFAVRVGGGQNFTELYENILLTHFLIRQI